MREEKRIKTEVIRQYSIELFENTLEGVFVCYSYKIEDLEGVIIAEKYHYKDVEIMVRDAKIELYEYIVNKIEELIS